MPPLDWSLVSLLAYGAVGGVLVALALLAIEYRAPRAAARCTVAAGCGLALLGGLAFLLSGTLDLTLSLAALAGIAFLAAIIRQEAIRRFATFLLTPAVLWGMVLAACLAGAAYVPLAARPALEDFPVEPAIDYHLLEGMVAVTDQGRQLRLCAYNESPSLLEQEHSIIGLAQYQHQLIRLGEPRTDCNCHGWVYAGGKYAIRSRDIDPLLVDNGYTVVSQPRAGDLAIYRTRDNEIAHTALVRMVTEDGSTFVESKWGPLGVYLHPVAAQPYGDHYAFYRSQRDGHLVQVLPSESVPAENSALAGTLAPPVEDSQDLIILRGRESLRPAQDRPVLRVPGQRKT